MIYAEDANYFKTGAGPPDKWIEQAKAILDKLGGKVLGEGFVANAEGKASYMLGFSIKGESYRIVWPVLPSASGDHRAARVQAATMLHHYIKSVALFAVIVGAEQAFFSHLMLPDGRTTSELAGHELEESLPRLMLKEGSA